LLSWKKLLSGCGFLVGEGGKRQPDKIKNEEKKASVPKKIVCKSDEEERGEACKERDFRFSPFPKSAKKKEGEKGEGEKSQKAVAHEKPEGKGVGVLRAQQPCRGMGKKGGGKGGGIGANAEKQVAGAHAKNAPPKREAIGAGGILPVENGKKPEKQPSRKRQKSGRGKEKKSPRVRKSGKKHGGGGKERRENCHAGEGRKQPRRYENGAHKGNGAPPSEAAVQGEGERGREKNGKQGGVAEEGNASAAKGGKAGKVHPSDNGAPR
jgi:hypothetical protein